ncbi:MAG: TonB-dependent receptor plug domain-containing protein [Flavobacteriales bacterium]|nr:TonB-dependent receptor plug domain-containing protein [Flavobacteriales bacterium]
MKAISLVCIIFCSSYVLYAQETITISGYLQEEASSEKLIGGNLYEFNSRKGTVTNDYGFFSLTVPKDSINLRISFAGFETQYYIGFPKEDLRLNFELKGLTLNEVVIIGTKEEQIHEKVEMSTIDLSLEKVAMLPVLMGEKDIMKTIQLLPGVQTGSEGTSGIYVRGGGADQNLILLDGVPIYNASHLFGFFSVFNADAINSVKLIKGGFPARYGGRLSSVIDIKMKEGNMKEVHGKGSIGLISSKFTIEGPIKKEKTSFIISARRTYIDILARPIINLSTDGSTGGYFFYDLNTKVNHKFSDKDRLYISAYLGNDKGYGRDKGDYVINGAKRATN